jgi:hypothetical protein
MGDRERRVNRHPHSPSRALVGPALHRPQQQPWLAHWLQQLAAHGSVAHTHCSNSSSSSSEPSSRASMWSRLALCLCSSRAGSNSRSGWEASQHAQQPAALAAAAALQPTTLDLSGGVLRVWQQHNGYRGDSLMPSGRYWLRQLGWDGGSMTPLLVAANAGAFGMQCVSPGFTNMCVRVSVGCVCVCVCVVGSSPAGAHETGWSKFACEHVCVAHTPCHPLAHQHVCPAAALGVVPSSQSQVSYKIAAWEYWRLLTPIFVHGNLLHVLVSTAGSVMWLRGGEGGGGSAARQLQPFTQAVRNCLLMPRARCPVLPPLAAPPHAHQVNTFAVYNLGRYVEGRFGSSDFLKLYIGSGAVCCLLPAVRCRGVGPMNEHACARVRARARASQHTTPCHVGGRGGVSPPPPPPECPAASQVSRATWSAS